MNKTTARFLIAFIYLSMLILHIIDFFVIGESETVGRGPNVVLRAIVTGIMIFILLPHHGRLKVSHNSIVHCVYFLLFYIITISLFYSFTATTAYSLVRVIHPLLGFLCFYYLAKYSLLDEKWMSFFYLVLIAIVAITAYFNLSIRMDSIKGLNSADNTGYALVCTYAGIILLTNKKIFSFELFLVIVGTLICGKRGAIIAMVVATLPLFRYMIFNHQIKNSRRILFLIFVIIGTIFAIRYFSNYFDYTLGRFENIQEDGGSGRNNVYLDYWNHFKSSNTINQMFGHGLYAGTFSSESRYSFSYAAAHNDWLELLFDFGIMGGVIYAMIFILMLRFIIRNIKNKNNYYYMLVMSFVIWFIKSVFSSTFLMDVSSIYLYMTAAYAIAKLEQPSNDFATIYT